MGTPLNGSYLTSADDGELERKTDKWARYLIEKKYNRAFALEVVRVQGMKAAGVTLSAESQAVLDKVKPILDAAAAVKARIPRDVAARMKFSPSRQPDWPA